MAGEQLRRGATRCLKLLRWYASRKTRVFPSQAKLAQHLKVGDRQVRSYLAELRRFGLIEVRQGGDGHTATYTLTSGLTSGLLPGCFRAETEDENQYQSPNEEVTGENFRAERPYSSSLSSSCDSQSERTVVESEKSPAAKTELEQAQFPEEQIEALKRHIRACGFEPSGDLLLKLRRKAEYYRVNLFAVSAHIERAWRKVANTSNQPRTAGWLVTVVENALKSTSEMLVRGIPADVSQRPCLRVEARKISTARAETSAPTIAAIQHQISALAAQKGL